MWGTTPTEVVKIASVLAFGNMFHNFMDYSSERNLDLFTQKQKLRVQATYQSGMPREALTLHPDLFLNGDCIIPCSPQTLFTTSHTAKVTWGLRPNGKVKVRYAGSRSNRQHKPLVYKVKNMMTPY